MGIKLVPIILYKREQEPAKFARCAATPTFNTAAADRQGQVDCVCNKANAHIFSLTYVVTSTSLRPSIMGRMLRGSGRDLF